jgi:hypothetical protein
MTMTTANWNGTALALACGLLTSVAAQAQPDTQPGTGGPAAADAPAPPATTTVTPPAPPATANSAADALKKQAGDVDQATLLKDTLTKTERQYSLLRAGRVAANYDLNYSYVGTESIDVGFTQGTGDIDLFRIETTRAHTITNTLSVDYGLLDNLTLSGTFPLVSKFTQSTEFSGVTFGIGDLQLGARYQPFVQTAGPTFTVTGNLSLPTGRSPFDQIIGQNTSTGSGYASGTLGINASQVFDPVALFGSLSFTAGKSVDHLHQFNKTDNSTLTGIRPGKGIGFGAGFTYALSYNVSTSVSFQENVTTSSTISVVKDNVQQTPRNTTMQVAALLNFGLGIRLNPKTTVNLTAGIGMTTDSPNFSLGLNLPLTFSLF